MILWSISCGLFVHSLKGLRPLLIRIQNHLLQAKHLDELKHSIFQLRQIKEGLECGLVPELGEWERISKGPAPWGPLFASCLMELRKQGAPVLPSLKRMLESLEEEREIQVESRTRISQAWGQVMISVALVPFFSLILYFLLPGLQDQGLLFLSLSSVSFLLSIMAFYWMLILMDRARIGGLDFRKRSWMISSKVFFEKMISDLMCGHPPDVAWVRSVDFMRNHDPELMMSWGVQIWDPIRSEFQAASSIEGTMIRFGHQIRSAVQDSLVEGRGSLDRLDACFRAFLYDVRMGVSAELQKLPIQCLKPLFILVFPAMMILLFGSLAMVMGGVFS